MKRAQLFLLLMCCSMLCAAAESIESIVFWYSEQEPEFEPDLVRYVVTERFLRSDDGSSENGFILLDRQQKKIFNVVPETRSILVLDGNVDLPQIPKSLVIDVQQSNDPEAPSINHRRVREIRVSSTEQLCYSAIVAPGLHDTARQAFLEFQQILASQQSKTIKATPDDIRTDCFMIQYLYAPAEHLKHGMLVKGWDMQGKQKQLVDYKAIPMESSLFELPADYRRYSP